MEESQLKGIWPIPHPSSFDSLILDDRLARYRPSLPAGPNRHHLHASLHLTPKPAFRPSPRIKLSPPHHTSQFLPFLTHTLVQHNKPDSSTFSHLHSFNVVHYLDHRTSNQPSTTPNTSNYLIPPTTVKMQFSKLSALAAAITAVSAWSNGTVVYTTDIVTAYTTYCPMATAITLGSSTYTVTEVRNTALD